MYVVTVSHVPPSRLVVLGAAVPPLSLLSGITGGTSVNKFLQILLKLFITNCQVLCMLSERFAFVGLCTLVTWLQNETATTWGIMRQKVSVSLAAKTDL